MPRFAVFVIGPGRSGTSLSAEIIANLGFAVCSEQIPSSYRNPRGFFEGKEEVEFHKEIYSAFGIETYTLPPSRWMFTQTYRNFVDRAQARMADRSTEHERLLIKDPRLSLILPIWMEACLRIDVKPKYVLCLRNPRAIVQSELQGHEDSFLAARIEIAMFNRIVQPILDRRGDLFVVNYEDWFRLEADLHAQLADYLEIAPEDRLSSEQLGEIICVDLDRARMDSIELQFAPLKALNDELAAFGSGVPDREAIVAIAERYRHEQSYLGGLFAAIALKNKELHQQVVDEKSEAAASLEAEVERLRVEAGELTVSLAEERTKASTFEAELIEARRKLDLARKTALKNKKLHQQIVDKKLEAAASLEAEVERLRVEAGELTVSLAEERTKASTFEAELFEARRKLDLARKTGIGVLQTAQVQALAMQVKLWRQTYGELEALLIRAEEREETLLQRTRELRRSASMADKQLERVRKSWVYRATRSVRLVPSVRKPEA